MLLCSLAGGLLGLAGCVVSQPAATPVVTAPPARSVQEMLATAEAAIATDRFADAARWYRQAAIASDDEQVIEEAATACYDNLQLQAALAIAQRWLQVNATSQRAHELAAQSALKLYQVDVAVEHLQALLDSAYITPAAGFMEWADNIAATDINAALAAMKKLVGRYPRVAEAQYVQGLLAQQAEDIGLMMESARQARQLAPYWSPAGMLLARAQLLRGERELALATASEVVRNDSSTATRSDYAQLLLQARDGETALTLWRELEANEGDNTEAVRALAQIDLEVGNYQSAFNRFNRLLNTGKRLSESIYYLGVIAERTGASDEARQLYERVQEGEFAAAAQLRVAKLILDSEGMPAAQTFLQSYADANPDQLMVTLEARARLFKEAGDSAGALRLYETATRDYPDVSSLRLAKAFLLVDLKKYPAALQVMRDLQQQRPDDPVILNAFGFTLLDHSRNYAEARDHIARALQFSPDSPAVLDSMGWALHRLGNQTEALSYLQKAAAGMVDAELDLHLGEVLWSLNRKDEARATWRKGLERVPDDKPLQQRLKRAGG